MKHTALFKHLDQGTILLTPNQRLADFHQQQHDSLTANIFAIDTWLQQLWQQYQQISSAALPLLLNDFQLTTIWQQIICDSTYAATLLNPFAVAYEAITAWQLLRQWQLPLSSLYEFHQENCQAFLVWAKNFAAYCTSTCVIDHHSMIDHIITNYRQKKLNTYKHIILYGFDYITPQLHHLFDVIKQQDCHIEHYVAEKTATHIYQTHFIDSTNEIRHMAQWAQYHASQEKKQIGCVVPRLSEIHNEVTYLFKQHCDHFNISIGKKFDRYPLIHTALKILRLNYEPWATNDMSYVLRSPYIDITNCTLEQRHQIDIALRNSGQRELTFTSFYKLDIKEKSIFECIKKFMATTSSLKHLPSEWEKLFRIQLEYFGWPGKQTLNSEEHQLVERFKKLLYEFSDMNTICTLLSSSEAFELLEQLTQHTAFQPKKAPAFIHILGILEASGLAFDRLWVSGMQSENWPAIASPNPFLPIALQRQLNMPHASAQHELTFSQQIMNRFSQDTSHIIFSYPQYDGDRTLQPSRLITTYPHIAFSELAIQPPMRHAERMLGQAILELISDDQAPAVCAIEKIKGGTQILQQQAACPFKAFATLRLHAKHFEPMQSGLNSKQRGVIIHTILETIWKILGDQQTLIAYTTQQRNDMIVKCINKILDNYALAPRYRELEITRLKNLLNNWLDIEATRPINFRVIACEQENTITINNFPINIRIDRIDELADGSLTLIDYKTNDPHLDGWFGERPQQPQLPFYCAYIAAPIKQLLFARIHQHDSKFIGITADKESSHQTIKPLTTIKKTTANSWNEQIQQWKNDLEKIIQEFMQGYAAVDPHQYPDTCNNCNLSALCRIHEVEITNE